MYRTLEKSTFVCPGVRLEQTCDEVKSIKWYKRGTYKQTVKWFISIEEGHIQSKINVLTTNCLKKWVAVNGRLGTIFLL